MTVILISAEFLMSKLLLTNGNIAYFVNTVKATWESNVEYIQHKTYHFASNCIAN